MEQATLDQLCINTLRALSNDAVQQAQSGHPGTLLYSLLHLCGVKAKGYRYSQDASYVQGKTLAVNTFQGNKLCRRSDELFFFG